MYDNWRFTLASFLCYFIQFNSDTGSNYAHVIILLEMAQCGSAFAVSNRQSDLWAGGMQ
jgi:hypothetical protein